MLTVLASSAAGDSAPFTPGRTSQLTLNLISPPTCTFGSRLYLLPPAGQHLLLLVFHSCTQTISSVPVGSWTLSFGSSGGPQPEKVRVQILGSFTVNFACPPCVPAGFFPRVGTFGWSGRARCGLAEDPNDQWDQFDVQQVPWTRTVNSNNLGGFCLLKVSVPSPSASDLLVQTY